MRSIDLCRVEKQRSKQRAKEKEERRLICGVIELNDEVVYDLTDVMIELTDLIVSMIDWLDDGDYLIDGSWANGMIADLGEN